MVGELDAGKLHVQFDEGVQETCDIAARLCPTLPQPLAILKSFKKNKAAGMNADERRLRTRGLLL